jgi:hypothetical protein
MFGLLFLGLLLFVPLLLLGVMLRLVFAIAFLPLRLAGLALKLTFGLIFGAVGLVVGLVALVVGCVVMGAVPVLLLAALAWLVYRLTRRKLQPTY